MIKVKFHEDVNDDLLKFSVIVARSYGKWVFCKHRERDTYECPGGHREAGESILETAKRELYEETGAVDYELTQIGVYSVFDGSQTTFGMLYAAEILSFDKLPTFEIERVDLLDTLPEHWTYPSIQPKLIKRVQQTFTH